jgi:hypothetical protein
VPTARENQFDPGRVRRLPAGQRLRLVARWPCGGWTTALVYRWTADLAHWDGR